MSTHRSLRLGPCVGAGLLAAVAALGYVYRPTAPDPRAPLFGLEWARGDRAVQHAATEHLVAKVAAMAPVADGAHGSRRTV